MKALLVCPLFLSGCLVYHRSPSTTTLAMVGTDADRLTTHKAGLEVANMNQSKGLDIVRKQLRSAALISAGVPAVEAVAKEGLRLAR